MASKAPHVLIIGAGIGGLTLAQTLRKKGISFEVFERDPSASARGQGYAVGLYDLDGLFGDSLPDDLPPLTSTCHLHPLSLPSQAIYHFPGGRKLYVEDTPETPCIRANRLRLRELLSTGVTINYGKTAARIEEDDDKVTVHFEDGTSATGDVLVGADGTFSAVRPHVLKKPNEEVLERFSAVVIVGETKLEGADMEQQLQLGHSCYLAFGPGYVLFSGVNRVNIDEATGKTSGDYYWVVWATDDTVNDPEHWAPGSTAQQKLDWAKEKVSALEPQFRVAVERTTPEGVKPYTGWWDADIPSTPPVGRVVLIGDAAHPMTPTRGEGAIFAIRDAVLLSKILGDSDKSDAAGLKTALNDFQQGVVARGFESIQKARASVANARAGDLPSAWGHTMKVLEEIKPLPIKLS